MSRTLFENSKAALAFAAMTIIGAVAMVGTLETSGVLGVAVDQLGAERETIASETRDFADQQSVSDKVSNPDSASAIGGSAFGDFPASEPPRQPVTTGPPSTFAPAQGNGPANASLAPGAIVAAPGDTDAPEANPVITGRKMTIEPQ